MQASARMAVIGGGRMGEAIVAGLVESREVRVDDIIVAEPDPRRRETLQAALGVHCVAEAARAIEGAGLVVLAVKPQVIETVATAISTTLGPGTLVVSIAAGVSCAKLETLLPAGTAVVRVMPNTPAMVQEAMSVVSGGSDATGDQIERVRALFGSLGKAVVLAERDQDVATALSGSGPAYVALFVDALARAGVRHGLTRDVAQTLTTQTLRGTVELLERTGQHPEQLIDAVASPGGTTAAALDALEASGFRAAVSAAVTAAVKRAGELGG